MGSKLSSGIQLYREMVSQVPAQGCASALASEQVTMTLHAHASKRPNDFTKSHIISLPWQVLFATPMANTTQIGYAVVIVASYRGKYV